MKNLPIAKAVFKDLIERNFCYVDKTQYIKQLDDADKKYWFLARPRRFGKSLFLDTIRAAFAGEKELFKDLFLEKNWEWNIKYPIIAISFGSSNVNTPNDTKLMLNEKINAVAKDFNIKLSSKTVAGKFEELITILFKKHNQSVVVLIDEYDKPILDNITEKNVKKIRKELAGFYSVLKDMEKYLKFVFITGVSKFSKTSIFSKLNNLQDISLDKKYADICGYTQTDLETVFAHYLHNVDLKKVKEWYDGYNFLGSNIYNPYDILLFLETKEYKSYWFKTGTPTFLLELIEEKKFFLPKLENIRIEEAQIEEFDISRIELVSLLLQTGYLSIKKTIKIGVLRYYDLQFPNNEVRIGFTEYLLRMFYTIASETDKRTALYEKIYFAIADNKPENLQPAFYSFFASIPVDWYRKNQINKYEGFYSSMFYAFFAAQGFTIIPEDFTNKGKIDMTVQTKTGIFKIKNTTKNTAI